jgi:hypothetical protein
MNFFSLHINVFYFFQGDPSTTRASTFTRHAVFSLCADFASATDSAVLDMILGADCIDMKECWQRVFKLMITRLHDVYFKHVQIRTSVCAVRTARQYLVLLMELPGPSTANSNKRTASMVQTSSSRKITKGWFIYPSLL